MNTIQKRVHAQVPSPVSKYHLNSSGLPLVIEPRQQGLKLDYWLRENPDVVDNALREHGAVLFRNFAVTTLSEFEDVVSARGRSVMDYDYASTPRTLKQGKIYTSTEYPAEKIIPQHNEMSYSRSFPKYLWFFCELPPQKDGETPLADSRKVYAALPQEIKTFFSSNELLYVRNYHPNVDLDWRTVFRANEPRDVEAFCSKRGIGFHWYSGGHLQTREISQVVMTLEEGISWFNQAHLFHITSLEPLVAGHLMKRYGEAFLPRNVYHGDGSRIPDAYLTQVRQTYDDALIQFKWAQNDVLLVDNLRVSHGRNSFAGQRKIAVAMTN